MYENKNCAQIVRNLIKAADSVNRTHKISLPLNLYKTLRSCENTEIYSVSITCLFSIQLVCVCVCVSFLFMKKRYLLMLM